MFDPDRLEQADPSLFDAAAYGAGAQPVAGRGGRGAAWFVSGAFGAAVLRHYLRGGWMARVSRDRYLWQDERRVRSWREYRLLHDMRALGLPVPAPLAAMYLRQGRSYRAAILVERVAEVRPLADLVIDGQAPWEAVGRVIARFHRHGFHHADLNGHNLLVDARGAIWLIDWDKGSLERRPGPWCGAVLDRLQRSLRKLCPTVPAERLAEGLRALQVAHDAELRS